MELGIISLSDIQTDPVTGRPFPYGQRLDEILGYATETGPSVRAAIRARA